MKLTSFRLGSDGLLVAALSFSFVGCSSASTAPTDKASDDEGAKGKHKKSKGDDDDDTDKKKKKKDKDDDLAPVASDTADTAGSGEKKIGGSAVDDDGRQSGDDAGATPPTVSSIPTPKECAPDPAGKLGASPKLLATAGAPGAALAVWGKANEAPLANLAVTLSADSRCYVEYMTASAPGAQSFEGATLAGGGGVHAIAGTASNSTAETATFKMQWSIAFHQAGLSQREDFVRFYGYAHSSPYACGAFPNGEKGCAMFETPIETPIARACVPSAKGGGPSVIVTPGTAKPKPTIAVPTLPTKIVAPPILDAGVASKPDAGSDAGDVNAAACDALACITNAGFWKDGTHVFAAFSAGKPKACVAPAGAPKPGEAWWFDGNAWRKH